MRNAGDQAFGDAYRDYMAQVRFHPKIGGSRAVMLALSSKRHAIHVMLISHFMKNAAAWNYVDYMIVDFYALYCFLFDRYQCHCVSFVPSGCKQPPDRSLEPKRCLDCIAIYADEGIRAIVAN
jgi:hypothetical protein